MSANPSIQSDEFAVSPGPSGRFIAAITALAFASAYFQIFIFPDAPVTPWGDPALFLEDAKRILNGQLPYRDYFQFTLPGIDYFYAAMLHIFGVRAWIPNVVMAFLAAAVVLLTTLLAKRVLSGGAVFLPGILFIGFALSNSLWATHQWFSTLAALGAALVLMDEISVRRAAAAGMLCGVAGYFTQPKGATVICALLLFFFLRARRTGVWKDFWFRGTALCAGALALLVAGNAYAVWTSGFSRFLFSTIVFPLRYYPAQWQNTWGVYGITFTRDQGVSRLLGCGFVYLTVPFAYLALLGGEFRKEAAEKKDRLLLVALVGGALFAAVAGAPSVLRLATVSPPAIICLVWLFSRNPQKRVVICGASALSLFLALWLPLRVQLGWHATFVTPTGRIGFTNVDRLDEVRWVAARTHAGEAFFGMPPVSFVLGLRDPAPINFLTTSDYTRPDQAAGSIRALETNRVRLLVLIPGMYEPSGVSGASDHLEAFREYLQSDYRLVKEFSNGDQAWARPGADSDSPQGGVRSTPQR